MEDENIISDTLADESHVNSPAVDETVSNVSATLSLSELNSYLGKNFKDKDTALKALKDTFSYVGKKREDIVKEVSTQVKDDDRFEKLAQELAEERRERFYLQNPQYASVRKVIEKFGNNPVEVVQSAEFKEIYEKVSGYDESQKLKTVLESNPRLSSSRDSLAKAEDMVLKTGKPTEEAERLVVNAVKSAFDL